MKPPCLQRAVKPMIYVLKIPSIDKQPKLNMRGGDMNINELIYVLFLPQFCPENGWQMCWFSV